MASQQADRLVAHDHEKQDLVAWAACADMTGSVITGIIAGTLSGLIGFALGWRARGEQQR